MRIVYDNIIFSLQKAGGISKYWFELIKRLVTYKDVEVIFYESENQNIFRKNINIPVHRESLLGTRLIRYLPFTKKIPSKSIFHSSYYRISLQSDVANVTTVHDFIYEYFRSGLAKYIHVLQKKIAIKRSDGIICISKNTKKDLLKFYPEINESKIKVIYNGVSDEFRKLNDPEKFLTNEFSVLKDRKYILYVGDRSKYKNFSIAVEVLRYLKDINLVVVGGKDFSEKEKELIKDVKDRIFHFKGIDDHKLNILYNNAFCLIYPSSYEGFGIPVVEAMKAGCPVISTNRSSIPEVAGDAAILVDDIKAESFVHAIKKLYDVEFRNSMINKGLEQANRFSWDRCFEETVNFYREIWYKKFGG